MLGFSPSAVVYPLDDLGQIVQPLWLSMFQMEGVEGFLTVMWTCTHLSPGALTPRVAVFGCGT